MKGEPFFFDEHHFDEDAPAKAIGSNTPMELKYTDDDLEIARNTSYAKGKKEGINEAQASLESQSLQLLENLLQQINALHQAEEQRNKRYEAEAIHLTTQILQKIFPVLFQKHGFEELSDLIKTTLDSCPKDAEIELLVNEDITDLVKNLIDKITPPQKQNLKIMPSKDIQMTSCQLSWPFGGAILAPEKTAGQVLGILKETLAAESIEMIDEPEEQTENIAPQDTDTSGEKDE